MKGLQECPKCKSRAAHVLSRREVTTARLLVKVCLNPECAKVSTENLPARGSKPNESMRGKLRARGQRFSQQVKAGTIAYSNGMWYPKKPEPAAPITQAVIIPPESMTSFRESFMANSIELPTQSFTPKFDFEETEK